MRHRVNSPCPFRNPCRDTNRSSHRSHSHQWILFKPKVPSAFQGLETARAKVSSLTPLAKTRETPSLKTQVPHLFYRYVGINCARAHAASSRIPGLRPSTDLSVTQPVFRLSLSNDVNHDTPPKNCQPLPNLDTVTSPRREHRIHVSLHLLGLKSVTLARRGLSTAYRSLNCRSFGSVCRPPASLSGDRHPPTFVEETRFTVVSHRRWHCARYTR